MILIGITGGVGAGKTKILSYIEEHYPCRVIRADETAHLLYEPGQKCYQKLCLLFGSKILNQDGTIDRRKLASLIFGNETLLDEVNKIVHPEVKKYILQQIIQEKEQGKAAYFFIEAALLIEENYGQIVDELWYIHADAAVRAVRLERTRQYSPQKTAEIMKGQLNEAEFREHCQVVILNNGTLEETYRQVDRELSLSKDRHTAPGKY